MEFPTIQFKNTNTEANTNLQTLTEQKFTSFERYIGDETDVKCEVEFEKVTPQKTGNVHRVEANLWIAGKLHRAEATESSFEMAIDEVRDELDKEMRRDAKRHETLVKRGGRKIKEMLRFGS